MKDPTSSTRGRKARLCAVMAVFLCLPNAVSIFPIGNSQNENTQSGNSRTALQLMTSVVETRYCSPSNLEVNLRLEFKNTGEAVLLFRKNSLVLSRYMVSRTLKAASGKDYEIDVSPMVNMKIFSQGLLVFTNLFCSWAAAAVTSMNASDTAINAPNKTMNAKDNSVNVGDRSMNSLKIGKVEVSRAGNITVEIENSSREPLRVWKDSNSWGAACWRVLLIRKGRVETFFQNPDQGFTKNWPRFNEIAAGGHIEKS